MKVSIPQGTRDFSAEVVQKRRYIFDTLRKVFEIYGFQPLETPSFENLETLMGKYGEEGDKLIFKILNNGLDRPEKAVTTRAGFEQVLEGKSPVSITERALRYDLTIPFARFIAMNHKQIQLPYKRYQMQPVWRADRPQKGRYREFYQCDADVAGSKSLWSDVECIHLYAQAFRDLNLPVTIKMNNRKALLALAQTIGNESKMPAITIAIDKLDKIGAEKTRAELIDGGLNDEQADIVGQYLSITGSNAEKIESLKALLKPTEEANAAIDELKTILGRCKLEAFENVKLEIDLTLARGLDYYTGSIYEVKANDVNMGSIGGGGRYNDLTGLFGVKDIPGIGISFGVDRIYDVMEELSLFPKSAEQQIQVLFFNTGDAEAARANDLLQQLRLRGIAADMVLESSKFSAQFKQAERSAIPYVAIIGSQENEEGTIQVKNLATGEQTTWKQDEFAQGWKPS